MTEKKERVAKLRAEIQNLNSSRTYARAVFSADAAICIALMDAIERRVSQVRFLLDGKGDDDV